MENFENKFYSYDPVAHHDAKLECHLSEVKARLLRGAERKLLTYLRVKLHHIKIADSIISSLEVGEDQESGAPVYTGKVDVTTTFLQKNLLKRATFPINIVANNLEIIETDIQKAIETATDISTVVEVSAGVSTVKASLKEFKLKDDGTKYFKVYHTAAYGDLEPIGAVSKDEFNSCAAKADLLKTMFQDEALSWPAEVEFIDEFSEPQITTASKEEIVYKVKEDVSLTPVVEASVDITAKFKTPDTFRFNVEAAQTNYNDIQRRIEQRAIIALVDSLKSNKMGNFKVKKSEIQYDTENKIGKVVIHTELLDGRDLKVVPFEIQINDGSMTLPTREQVVSLLKETKIVESIETSEVKTEVTSVQVENLPKEAHTNAPPMWGYQEVLRVPKEFLPASLKVDDCIEVDGLRYKLVSKSEGQLSKERDSALHWMFERVHDPYSKPIYRVDY